MQDISWHERQEMAQNWIILCVLPQYERLIFIFHNSWAPTALLCNGTKQKFI